MKDKIDNNIYFSLSILLIIISAVIYVGTIKAQSERNEYRLNAVEKEKFLILKKLDTIQERLSSIEGFLRGSK